MQDLSNEAHLAESLIWIHLVDFIRLKSVICPIAKEKETGIARKTKLTFLFKIKPGFSYLYSFIVLTRKDRKGA